LRELAARSMENPPAAVAMGTIRVGARHGERASAGAAKRERVTARSAATHARWSRAMAVRRSRRGCAVT
jgi:hypothetical protein